MSATDPPVVLAITAFPADLKKAYTAIGNDTGTSFNHAAVKALANHFNVRYAAKPKKPTAAASVKTGDVTLRLPDRLDAKIRATAGKQRVTPQQLVIEVLRAIAEGRQAAA